jgi:membrane-associated phospholipid phosphatase
MFPYFPSDPPRVVFPGADLPGVVTPIRAFNLHLVGNYGIHSSVFPSAHVSMAFASAWGLICFLPERPWVGRLMLVYAISVAVATVYGRYHYAVDAAAGAVVGLVALAICLVTSPGRGGTLSPCSRRR